MSLSEELVEDCCQPVARIKDLPFGNRKRRIEKIFPYVGTLEMLFGLRQVVDLPAIDGAVMESKAGKGISGIAGL